MRLFLLVPFLAVSLYACGDSAQADVVFGEGEMPQAFPSDFPIPGDAVIGSTLVDFVNTKSQFEFRTAMTLDELTRLLSVGLVNQGYVIDESNGGATRWRLAFRKGDLEGIFDLNLVGEDVTQGVAEVNDA